MKGYYTNTTLVKQLIKRLHLSYDNWFTRMLYRYFTMSRNVAFKVISLHPRVLERIDKLPGLSYTKKIEWLLNAVEVKQNTAETKMSYDELIDYVIAQSKLQCKEKVLGLIVGLLRCFL